MHQCLHPLKTQKKPTNVCTIPEIAVYLHIQTHPGPSDTDTPCRL